jgi:hypothetical protein
MELQPIFSVGVGRAYEPALVPIARQLFEANKTELLPNGAGSLTTLQTYNSTQDCAELASPELVNTIKETIRKNAIKFYAGRGFDVDLLNFDR